MPHGWTVVPEQTAPPAAAGWTPVQETPTFKTVNEPPSKSLWEQANTPLVPQIAEAAHAIADYLSMPKLDQSKTMAQIKGFLAGATQGAGDLVAGFTSPVGIALTLSGLGEAGGAAKAIPGLKTLLKLPAVQAAQRAVQATAGAGFTAHGAGEVLEAPTLGGKAQGAVEMATGALGMASALPRARVPQMGTKVPEDAAAVSAGLAAGVPVDLATATGNKAVRGAQFLADRSIGGSLVAEPAQQRAAQAFDQWGGKLATEAAPKPATPDVAGQGVREALAAKLKGHNDAATKAYDTLRALEADPAKRMQMPVKPDPVGELQSWQVGELRRIVHEMDASGYTPKVLEQGKYGGSLEHVEGTGGAGAKVFDDITQRSGSTATRGVVQSQIETFLGGGPMTPNIKAALEVAKARNIGNKGVSTPELPRDATSIPTRLESQRVTSEEMGLPVQLVEPKQALQPLYDQMMRQMPITQQQASPGLKAIENILNAPDYAPLSQIDADLSAIKAVARQHGGLAKMAVAKLEAAVQEAARNGGPEVVKALHEGRKATIAKYQTEGVLEALPGGKLEEPMAVFNRATAPKDAGIELLRQIKSHTPDAVPALARAKLETLLELSPDKAFAEWQKQGTQTRGILFPKAGHSQALDHFFRLQKLMATNPNPSGTAYVGALGVQGAAFWTNPIASIVGQAGAAGVSSMLHSPAVTRALTQVVAVSRQPAASGAARAAALASLSRASQAAGIGSLIPAAGQVDEPNGR